MAWGYLGKYMKFAETALFRYFFPLEYKSLSEAEGRGRRFEAKTPSRWIP